MTKYAVELTDTALAAIAEQALYIADDAQAPVNARRWLQSVRETVVSLARFPRRCRVAEEDSFVDYEVRQVVVCSHLLLFTINDDRCTVVIVGLRHGHRRPRPDGLTEV